MKELYVTIVLHRLSNHVQNVLYADKQAGIQNLKQKSPVNKLLHVDHSGEVYTRKCERKTMFYWFMLIHILSSILCTCAIGYLTILLICSTDTVIKLGAWLLLISPIIGLLEISIFLIICCKGCGYHTVFFPEDY